MSEHKVTALVTGASAGLGAEFCRQLAPLCDVIIAVARRKERLEALASDLAGSVEVHCLEADLGTVAGVATTMEAIRQQGPVDYLVNNAGFSTFGHFDQLSIEGQREMVNLHVDACITLCRAAIPFMRELGGGKIINVSSIVGTTGNPGQANYAASKAGVVAMSKSLAYEVASRGITVNCVAPGFITTAMTEKLTDEQKSGILTQVPAGRMGTAGEIAAAALYLASEQASYVTGATLHVNGGMAML